MKKDKYNKRNKEMGERMDFLEKRMVEKVYKSHKAYNRKPKYQKDYKNDWNLEKD